MLFLDCSVKSVGRLPRRMLPPMIFLSISGMKTTALVALGSCENSSDVASVIPHTARAYSIVATCIPKQIPKYGILFSRAHLAARIMPSIPRLPNPPGTKIPLAVQTLFHASWYLIGS